MSQENEDAQKQNATKYDANAAEEAQSATQNVDLPTRVVGIGASAGGLVALRRFFDNMPEDTGMTFVVIQHLSPDHSSELPQILQSNTNMQVMSIDEDRITLQPNRVYVISPDHSLQIDNGELQLLELDRSLGSRSVIDLFFRSLAKDAAERAVGIILSGTGADGSQGLGDIKEHGGITIVQDFEDADFEDMPRNAMHANLIDLRAPANEIPRALIDLTRRERNLPLLQNPEDLAHNDGRSLQNIFRVLLENTGHDFSGYKQSTVLRRLARRMNVHGLDDMQDYVRLLRDSPQEQDALFRELLITVTNFFRDPTTFKYLEDNVIPDLLSRKTETDTVRLWVVGCATGEEAYSLAMLLHEQKRQLSAPVKIQIFASDIDRSVLDIAREGVYPRSIEADVSRERLAYFFDASGDSYRVKAWLREMVLFSTHNLVSDPPFARLDMISCRNVLIYFKSDLQSQVFDTFHYALEPEGILLLGNSENAPRDTFNATNKSHHIFERNSETLSTPRRVPSISSFKPRWQHRKRPKSEEQGEGFLLSMQRLLLDRYMPPSVLVNEDYDVMYIVGKVGRYLEPPQGEPNYNVLEMAHEGLRLGLRTALIRAFRQDQDTVDIVLPIDTPMQDPQPEALPPADEDTPEADTATSPATPSKNNERRNAYKNSATGAMVRVSVRCINRSKNTPNMALISFDSDVTPEVASLAVNHSEAGLVAELERELTNTRESLQSTVKEMETSNEELRASNEELQSLNEELQSTNEEVTTSKEELQSTYEELTIVNSELEDKVSELEQLNNDLANFIASTEIATVFIDAQRNLKRYTPQATSILNIINVDLGRPFSHISHNLEDTDLSATIEQVLDDLQPLECEIKSQDKRWFIMRARPYRTADDRIDGVVITWNDVTSIKREQEQLRALFDVFPDTIIRVDKTSKHLSIKSSGSVPGIDESLAGSTFEQNTTPEYAAIAHARLREAFETGEVITQKYNDALGRGLILEARVVAINDQEAFQIVRNVTDSESLALALRESNEQLELVLEGGELAFWDWNPQTNSRVINDTWAHMFGYHLDKIAANLREGWFPPVHPDDEDTREANFRAHFAGDTPMIANEFRMQHKEGHWVWVRERGKVVARNNEGEPTRVVGVLIDISAEKASARAIQAALEEKEMLLKELNHRVKNNLQMVASMLSIQSRQVEDTEMRDMLLANRARIQTISLVHQELYGENFDGYLNLEAALHTISKGIASLTEDPAHHIAISFAGVPVSFAIDRAIPLGLVVGELVGNACKHAFPAWADISQPKVSIKLMETDSMLVLEVYDNGVGFNHPRLKSNGNAIEDPAVSMGDQLISGFVSQIDGTISQDIPYPDNPKGYVGTRSILHVPKQNSVKK